MLLSSFADEKAKAPQFEESHVLIPCNLSPDLSAPILFGTRPLHLPHPHSIHDVVSF